MGIISDIHKKNNERFEKINSYLNKNPENDQGKPIVASSHNTTSDPKKIRDFRLIIREGAIHKKQVLITYKKADGRINEYTICPISYRFRRLRNGFKKVLFVIDSNDGQLKNFVYGNIKKVTLTDKPYVHFPYHIEIN